MPTRGYVKHTCRKTGAWNNLGAAYHSLQQYDAAKAAWYRVLETSPSRGGSTNRGLQQETYETAISLAEPMMEINPSDWQTGGLLATYYVHAGRENDARALIDHTLTISNRSPDVLLSAALIHFALDETEETLQALEEMVERDDSYRNYIANDPDFQLLRGNERYHQLIN